jgi:hypothetical protein
MNSKQRGSTLGVQKGLESWKFKSWRHSFLSA